jgi:hypothetical protein
VTRPSNYDRDRADAAYGAESVPESTDGPDADADEHEQWLRENVPPHHG